MPAKRIFLLLLVTFWVAEPFLSLVALHTHLQHRFCSNAAMDEMGSEPCCSINSNHLCSQRLSGLYSAGCTPDSARNLFFAQGAVKFLPPSQPLLFRMDLKQAVALLSSYLPVPSTDVISPPPELDHFA